MTMNRKKTEDYIRWNLHSNNCSLWWDNWLGTGPFKLNGFAPTHKISEIMHTLIQYRPAALDKAIWTPNIIGKFTNKLTWHKKIPFKWSFCVWRALRNKLPTDDKVLQFSSLTVTRCVCCNTPAAGNADHIFSHGNFAKLVWRKYGGPAGVQTEDLTLRLLLMKWCSAKYGAKTSSLTRVLHSIDADIQLLLSTNYPTIKLSLNWTELYGCIENIQHHTSIKKVAWTRPDTTSGEINTDGSALTNSGLTGAGVIIRGSYGEFILALTCPLGEGTNNSAETKAAILGVQWCIANGFTKIHLEADSSLLSHWLNNDGEPPWTLQIQVQKLQSLLQQCEKIYFSHVYREANCPADSLSKLSHNLLTITNY
ncbi:uncharacterized protein [Nicotiana tomentosiformis]|uniref:uncharacterized protein n=1 Tax=Nicotiana tomentosiformis TaxID=4098 RepID=UPI00051AC659|nr:uncharacterized protein LOC104091883 [Nicotiana tomentosiformis]